MEDTAWAVFFIDDAVSVEVQCFRGWETVFSLVKVTSGSSLRGVEGEGTTRGTSLHAQDDEVSNGTGDIRILGGKRVNDDIPATAEGAYSRGIARSVAAGEENGCG